MSIFTDMLKLGDSDVPCDRTKVISEVTLRRSAGKWRLTQEHSESIVSLAGITRSADIAPRPFIDNVEYTFGVSVAKGPEDTATVTYTPKAKRCHEAYVAMIANSGLADHDKDVKAFLEFIGNDPYKALTEGQTEAGVKAINKALLAGISAIRVCVFNDAFAELHADTFSTKPTGKIRCSLSGQIEDDVDIKTEALRKVHGASSNLITISCNTEKYDVIANYNFDKMDGSPVSARSKMIITRNLQNLFSTPNLRIRVPNSSGITYLFNYDKATEEEKGVVNAVLNTPKDYDGLRQVNLMGDDEEDKCFEEKESCESIVWRKYMSIKKKGVVTKKASGKVTVYRIHVAQGRWSCTDTFTVDIETLFANIDRWYADIMTKTGYDLDGGVPPLYNLLRASRPEKDKFTPREYENMMRSILLGTVIDANIMKHVLHRAEISHRSSVTSGYGVKCQISLIRACYNSRARHNNKQELTDMLDTSNKSFAYNLGRLLAVGDFIQYKVHNDKCGSIMSAGLDKRAVVRPVECLSVALQRIKNYMTQINRRADKQWVVKLVSKIVDEVTTNTKTHAGALTIDEQAEMRCAYWQQRQEFYKKNTNTTTNNKD